MLGWARCVEISPGVRWSGLPPSHFFLRFATLLPPFLILTSNFISPPLKLVAHNDILVISTVSVAFEAMEWMWNGTACHRKTSILSLCSLIEGGAACAKSDHFYHQQHCWVVVCERVRDRSKVMHIQTHFSYCLNWQSRDIYGLEEKRSYTIG